MKNMFDVLSVVTEIITKIVIKIVTKVTKTVSIPKFMGIVFTKSAIKYCISKTNHIFANKKGKYHIFDNFPFPFFIIGLLNKMAKFWMPL